MRPLGDHSGTPRSTVARRLGECLLGVVNLAAAAPVLGQSLSLQRRALTPGELCLLASFATAALLWASTLAPLRSAARDALGIRLATLLHPLAALCCASAGLPLGPALYFVLCLAASAILSATLAADHASATLSPALNDAAAGNSRPPAAGATASAPDLAEPDATPLAAPVALPAMLPDSAAEPAALPFLPDQAIAWATRTRPTALDEQLIGGQVVEFDFFQKQQIVHLVFCPPLDHVPMLELDLETDAELRTTVAAVYRYGARIEIKRLGPCDIRDRAVLHWSAARSQPAPAARAAA